MAQQIQIRRDTSTNWTSANPILAQGELGIEINTNRIKIGNGTTAWNSLPYYYTPTSMASLVDVSFSSLASGQIPVANASGIFINQSLVSLVNEVVSFASLGSLAVMDQLSFTSLTNQPSLSSLAFQATIDYTSAQLTNKPALGSLAVMNQLSFSSLLNQPSLGSLAYLSSISQIHLPSTASFNNLVLNGLQANSTASINQIRSTGFITGTATMSDLNSGVYNLYEGATQKAIFDGFFGGRFRANASQETFLFENYDQMRMSDNFGQDVWKVDGVNFIIARTLFANAGTQNFGNARATTLESSEIVTNVFRASNISTGLINTATANTSTLNAGIVVTTNIRSSLISTTDIYGAFGNFDSIGAGVGTFNVANTSSLNFDSGFGNYMGLGIGLGTSRVLNLSDIGNNTLSYIGFNEGSTEKWAIGTQSGEFGIFDTAGAAFRMKFEPSGEVGIGTGDPTARLDVEQLSTTAAIPTLELTQSDLSEEFINFVSTIGTGNPIIASSTATTFSHKVRVSVNGTFKWLYLYNA